MALQLARDDALVFGDIEGAAPQPGARLAPVRPRRRPLPRRSSAPTALPVIRLHDLRHTHATILLPPGVPVHVVSQRLGHASPIDHPDGLRARHAG